MLSADRRSSSQIMMDGVCMKSERGGCEHSMSMWCSMFVFHAFSLEYRGDGRSITVAATPLLPLAKGERARLKSGVASRMHCHVRIYCIRIGIHTYPFVCTNRVKKCVGYKLQDKDSRTYRVA